MTMKWETEPPSTWMFWSRSRRPSMLATSWMVLKEGLKMSLCLFPSLTRVKLKTWHCCGFSDLSPLFPGLTVSIPGLERALHQYTLEPSEKPFDLKSVPLATAPIIEQRAGEESGPLNASVSLHWACWELLSSILFEFCGIASPGKTKTYKSGCSHINVSV